MASAAPDLAFSTPLLSVDVIPLIARAGGDVEVLLSRRIYEPYRGELALPGVLMVAGETLVQACLRALRTKSAVEVPPRYLKLVGLADSPERDERGPTISAGYLAVIDEGEDALGDARNQLFRADRVPAVLPFDHAAIIRGALAWGGEHLWDGEGALARALLGDRFTTVTAVRLISQLDPAFNITNGGRLLSSKPFLERVGQVAGARAGRPANLWKFR